jgi:chaperonin GroES
MAKETTKGKGGSNGSTPRIRPLGDRALVRLLDPAKGDETTASGIILPATLDKDHSEKRGTVVAVGPGRKDDGELIPMEVKAGDEVIFQWGDKVEINKEEYYIVSESNIIAVVE